MVAGLFISVAMIVMAFFDTFGSFDEPTLWIGNILYLLMGIAVGVILAIVYIYVTTSGPWYLMFMAIFSTTIFVAHYFVGIYMMREIARASEYYSVSLFVIGGIFLAANLILIIVMFVTKKA